MKSPLIKARLAELNQAVDDAIKARTNRGIMTASERKERLTEIARARIPDFISEEGIKVEKDSPNVAAVAEITTKTRVYRKTGEPITTTNLKLHNPISAIDLLNKMENMYSDSHVINLNQNIQNVEARIVNFNEEAVAKAILEAAKLGLVPAVFGGNGHGEGADVLPSPANIQTTAVPEPED